MNLNTNYKLLLIIVSIITLFYISNTQYTLNIEPFVDKKLKEWLEPRMCYGWFFKIKIPIINITIKLCVPGLVIPIPTFFGRGSGSDGYSDCDGTRVCEM
jgi:hypothetical protein